MAEEFKIGGIQQETIEQVAPATTEQTPEVTTPENVTAPVQVVPEQSEQPEVSPQAEVVVPAPEVVPEVTPEVTPEAVVPAPVAEPTPEVVAEPVPEIVPAPVIDPEYQRYQDFKQENPKASMQDWAELNQDWLTVSDMDVIKKAVRDDNSSTKLSDAQVISLIERDFDVDLADGFGALEDSDKLEITLAAGKYREQLTEIQESYNAEPESAQVQADTPTEAVPDTVRLVNGDVVNRQAYETARTRYKAEVQKVVGGMESETYSFEVGSGDDKKTISIDYIVEQNDRQSLLSELDTVPMHVLENHLDDSGNLDYAGLSKAQLMKNEARSKTIVSRLLSLAYAQGQEEILKQETNVNFDTRQPDNTERPKRPVISREDVVTVKMAGF